MNHHHLLECWGEMDPTVLGVDVVSVDSPFSSLSENPPLDPSPEACVRAVAGGCAGMFSLQ